MRSHGSFSSPTAHIAFCTLDEVLRPHILSIAFSRLRCGYCYRDGACHRKSGIPLHRGRAAGEKGAYTLGTRYLTPRCRSLDAKAMPSSRGYPFPSASARVFAEGSTMKDYPVEKNG